MIQSIVYYFVFPSKLFSPLARMEHEFDINLTTKKKVIFYFGIRQCIHVSFYNFSMWPIYVVLVKVKKISRIEGTDILAICKTHASIDVD